MKPFFLFILICLFANFTFAQSLGIKDFRKLYGLREYNSVVKKGFTISCDTVGIQSFMADYKNCHFQNAKSGENFTANYYEDTEGAYGFSITYYFTSEKAYRNFITSLITFKFKYSKRHKLYNAPTSSYSGETVTTRGSVVKNSKKYFCIEYENYTGKELSAPKIVPDIGDSLQVD